MSRSLVSYSPFHSLVFLDMKPTVAPATYTFSWTLSRDAMAGAESDDNTSSGTEFSSGDESILLDDVCEDDRCKTSTAAVWYCVDCDSNYCSECWQHQGPHKKGKSGRDGVPHERTDVKVVARLKRILQPPNSITAVEKSHQADQCTKWFGELEILLQGPFMRANHGFRRLSRCYWTAQPTGLWTVCHSHG